MSATMTPRRPSARDYGATVVSSLISSNQPLTKAQIADVTGIPAVELLQLLQDLCATGRVTTIGAGHGRRYDVPPPAPKSDHAARTQAGRERNAARMTSAVQRIGLRDRVMKAVMAQPGELGVRRLAEMLEEDGEDIREALAWHVERERLELVGDGYARTSRAVAHEAGI